MRMRWIPALLLLPLLALPAWAGDEKPDVLKLVNELTYDKLARKAVDFHDAGDLESFLIIARQEDDPWVMAEELLFLGRADLAQLVAKAVPGALTAKLPAYVASSTDAELRTRLHAIHLRAFSAFQKSDHKAVLAATRGLTELPRTVLGLRIWQRRARALIWLRGQAEGVAAFTQLRDAARDMGWLLMANRATHGIAYQASSLGDWRRALGAYEATVAFARAHGPPQNVIWGLRGVGLQHKALGAYDAADAAFREGLAESMRLGYEPGVADMQERAASMQAARGKHRQALAIYDAALAFWKKRGSRAALRRAHILTEQAGLHQRLDEDDRARQVLERALVVLDEAPPHVRREFRRAYVLLGLAYVHLRQRRPEKARELITQARDIHRANGDELRVAETGQDLANVQRQMGDLDAALATRRTSLDLFRRLNMRASVAGALEGIAIIQTDLADFGDALDLLRRAHDIYRELKADGGIARTLAEMGRVHQARGSLEGALLHYRRAHASFAARGERRNAAMALRQMGFVQGAMGRYAEALENFQHSMKIERALGNALGIGEAQNGIGTFYGMTGQFEDALVWFRRAIATRRSLDPPAAVGGTLVNMAAVLKDLGRSEEALAALRQAMQPAETGPRSANRANALMGEGALLGEAGDHPGAQARFEQAHEIATRLGDRRLTMLSEANIALSIDQQGDGDEALKRLRRAFSQAEHLRLAPMVVKLVTDIARLRLARGESEQALLTARQAGPHLELILGGLGESGSAGARAQFAELYAVGTLAAARQDAPADMLYFLENGRAGALLETLRGRSAMRWVDLSPELRDAEQAARAKEAHASWAYERAIQRGTLKPARQRAAELDEARRAVREVSARIQREAKREAGVFYPRAAPMEEIQGALKKDQALVTYAFCLNEVVALVLQRGGERIVRLGPAAAMRSACAALEAHDATQKLERPLAALGALLVMPLALGDDVKEVLVSPDGPLSYLPYGLLFASRRVALTPSGTTHALLATDRAPAGRRVLALGDPAYAVAAKPKLRGGRRLTRLPATRAEVEAIGDVVLLGAQGTEAGLVAALGKEKRWRAVHLACHGLVDSDRPLLSSLALSPGAGSDGSLSALEVLRTRIPADLVTLSACETAKGKIQRAEGIVGLTRAFMYAGAPRVLCSLWKVDDEATKALMVEFYRLWNPKKGTRLGAAAALKKAQAYVRDHPDHPKWKHPYYWAAWVLWGLPD